MNFTKQYRREFVGGVMARYDSYVQAIHPLTFNPIEDLYQYRYSEQAWKSLCYLRDEVPDAVNSNRYFNTILHGMKVSFWVGEDFIPWLEFNFYDIPHSGTRDKIEAWLLVLRQYEGDGDELRKRLNVLMDEADGCCNTPGQLIEIWPTLAPYLNEGMRTRINTRRARSKAPDYISGGYDSPRRFRCEEGSIKPFDKDTVEQFQRLDHALVAAILIPDNCSDNYPSIE